MPSDFEQLLAQHNAALKQGYDEAAEYSDWMPDDGEYIVSRIKCTKGVSTKKDPNNPMFWWKPVVRIEADPALMGQEFVLGFFNTNAPGIMKREARALNHGTLPSFDELDGVFTRIGEIIRVEVRTATSKKDGKDYTNCYVKEVIATEAVAEETTEPPQREKVPS